MNDFIDLPHLPECLLGLPLETIHEIHSHTYHAIKADRQQRGEPVAVVDGDETGTWAEFVPGCDLVPGQELYTTPQPATPSPVADGHDHIRDAAQMIEPAQVPSVGQIMEAVESYGAACRQPNITVSEQEMRLHGIRALLARYGDKT